MTTLRTALVGAATLIAAVALTAGPAAAGTKVPAGTTKTFWGTGPTASAAHEDAMENASELGCQANPISGSASQQADGSWQAWVYANCGIL